MIDLAVFFWMIVTSIGVQWLDWFCCDL